MARYADEDFTTLLKIRFVYYLTLTLMLVMLFTTLATIYNQTTNNQLASLKWRILGADILMVFVFFACFILIAKGFYRLATHIVMVMSFFSVWTIMFIEQGEPVTRLDTIVYLFIVLSATPIFILGQRKWIVFYTVANLLALVVFVRFYAGIYNGNISVLKDFFLDSSIALSLVGFIAYNNFNINRIALEKAHNDTKERMQAEELLAKSEKKFREMTDFLPQTVFEADLNGTLTYVNKFGFIQFGYDENEMAKMVNVLDTVIPQDRTRAKENVTKIIGGQDLGGTQYMGVRKDGSTFPMLIHTNCIVENHRPIGLRGVIIDISDRLKAEEEVRTSRDQFQSLVNNIPGITYRCKYDAHWTMLYMSTEIDRLSGYPASDFIGNSTRSYSSVIHPDDTENAAAVVENAIDTNNSWELEYRIVHKDGHIRWAFEKGNAIKENDGSIAYLDGFILDITQRKEAEIQLAASENRFRHLYKNAPVPFASVNSAGEISNLNLMFEKTLGYTINDLTNIEEWWNKAYPEGDYKQKSRTLWLNEVAKAKEENREVSPIEFNVMDKSGKEHIMLIGASIIDDTVLASFVDITDRKLAERKLRDSEESFKSLIELLPHPILVVDNDGRHLVVNNSYLNDLGCTRDEALGKKSTDFAYSVDEGTIEWTKEQLRKHGFVENVETTAIIKGNRRANILFSSKHIQYNGQQALLVNSVDITKLKETERQLEEYKNNLEQLVEERTQQLAEANQDLLAANEELNANNEELFQKNQIINNQNDTLIDTLGKLRETQTQLVQKEKMASLGILTAGVAHEINNPLNFIMGGYVGLENYFAEHKQANTDETAVLLSSIKTGIDRAASIVRSLNLFSRDKQEHNEQCDIHAIIDNCLVMLNNQIKDKAEITKEYAPVPIMLTGNVGQLHQVFVNLLSNCLHAIGHEGNIGISTRVEGQNAVVEVTDNGCGIPPEMVSKITDPFFTTKQPGEGTGLGLSITYNIVKEHNGSIDFVSIPNQGTKATVTIPIENLNQAI